MEDIVSIKYIGIVVDENDMSNFEALSVAGNKMQLGILKGLYAINSNIEVVSSFPYKMFNTKGKLFVPGGEKLIFGSIKARFIPYINILIMKQILISIGNILSLVRWSLNKKGKKVLIVYNTISYISLPVIIIGKLFKCKTVCVVADLPIKNVNKNIIHRLEDWIQIKLIGKFDGLVPLTEKTPKDFAPKTPYIVVEAGFDNKKVLNNKSYTRLGEIKKVVFTGTLNSLSGIELLLEAFGGISNDDIELHFFGSGEREKIIAQYVNQDRRIVYHGSVSNEEVLLIQQNADLLVSPRLSDSFTTKYTFPSKILEYIISGTPVLANRLQGIPSEYENLINYTQDESPDGWRKAIMEILGDDSGYYIKKAEQAKQSVLTSKSWSFQAKRIYKFINKLFE